MDEQMIADIAKALHQSEAELFGYVGRSFELDALWRQNERRYLREARAAHSVIAGKVAEPSLADEVRAIAEDSNYSNEMLGITVRNWFHRQAALAPYPERR